MIRIKNYNYMVTKNGEIFSMGSNKFLKNKTQGSRYEYVLLSKNGKCKKFYVHRLVAKYFIPNPENKPQVNHIDGNKLNNSVSNLQWVTREENMRHSFEILENPRIDYINWLRGYQNKKPKLIPKCKTELNIKRYQRLSQNC